MVTVGTSVEAVCSSFWCYVDEGPRPVPDVICFIPSDETLKFIERLKACFNVIAGKELVFKEPVVIDEADVEGSVSSVVKVISRFKEEGFHVVVDVTPGRKTMSIAAYQAAIKGCADEIVYFHLKDPTFERKFYPLIPRKVRRLVFLKR